MFVLLDWLNTRVDSALHPGNATLPLDLSLSTNVQDHV